MWWKGGTASLCSFDNLSALLLTKLYSLQPTTNFCKEKKEVEEVGDVKDVGLYHQSSSYISVFVSDGASVCVHLCSITVDPFSYFGFSQLLVWRSRQRKMVQQQWGRGGRGESGGQVSGWVTVVLLARLPITAHLDPLSSSPANLEISSFSRRTFSLSLLVTWKQREKKAHFQVCCSFNEWSTQHPNSMQVVWPNLDVSYSSTCSRRLKQGRLRMWIHSATWNLNIKRAFECSSISIHFIHWHPFSCIPILIKVAIYIRVKIYACWRSKFGKTRNFAVSILLKILFCVKGLQLCH